MKNPLNFFTDNEYDENTKNEFPNPLNRTKTLKEKLLKKNTYFRIGKKADWKRKLRFRLGKFKKEMEVKEPQSTANVVHIAENGDIYLIPAYQSVRTINYIADKEYRKKYDHSKRITIHYFDGITEQGLLCDSLAPSNIKVNPSIEKTAVHSKREFENAYDTFEKDLIRTTTFSYSDKQIKTLILFLIAGIGLGALMVGGAVFILMA